MGIREYNKYLFRKMKGKRVAIWGIGKKSIYAENLLQELGITEWGFLDNDIEKCQREYHGKEVYSPDCVSDPGKWYIVIGILHSDELVDQLKRKGLQEIEDFMCILKNDLYYYLFQYYGEACGRYLETMKDVRSFGEDNYGFSVCCKGYEKKAQIILYTFGVGENLSFSQEFSNQYRQCKVYAFDPTPRAIEFVEMYDKTKFNNFSFFEYGLSDTSGSRTFYLPKESGHVSCSEICTTAVNKCESIKVQMRTLKELMNSLGHTQIDLLKLDIEGSEFTVIPQFLQDHCLVTQICVELHDRLMANGEIERKKLLDILYKYHYKLIYMSQTGDELTFIKE